MVQWDDLLHNIADSNEKLKSLLLNKGVKILSVTVDTSKPLI